MLCKTARGALIKIRMDLVSERPHAMTNYQLQGTTGVYHFSATNHQGITENPLLLARIVNGKVEVAK